MFKNVTCPSCGRVNQISNVRKYIGKKVRLNCLNTACGKAIIPDLIDMDDGDMTIVIKKPTQSNQIGKLIHTSDNVIISEFVLAENENIAGRNSSTFTADIHINNDPYISRKQFIIKAASNAGDSGNFNFILSDCNSKNKTYLNGQALEANEEIFLRDGDIIAAGKSTFEFRISEKKIEF
ncbi:MAG: FHA domain-containing protein [Saprospiraceae bacterium]|nr:FHA domain-containing protein [Saprospiraceae bacterium]